MLHKLFIIQEWLIILFLSLNYQLCFAQQNDAELINQQTIIEVSKDKLTQTFSFEIRINNRAGDKYAEISIPFDKMNKVSGIEASITDNSDNEVQKLRKKDIIERSLSSDISFYDDTYVKEFALRNHTYPYTLKYSFCMESSQFWTITNWFPVIAYKIATRQATLKLSTPLGYHIIYHSNQIDNPKIDSVSGRIDYLWQTSYTNTIIPETWSASLQQFIPYVEIVPENFNYVYPGSNKSWESFGNWNLSLLNGLDDLPLNEKFIIHSLTDTIQDEKAKIRVLFRRLQDETRYINVSIKTGGMRPYPASYVAEKKYGDCKALTNYFKSCLAVIGINSFYTAINSGDENKDVDTSFPSQQFNHVILFVPTKQDTLWIDCTSNLAFGYLGTYIQNRPALVMANNTSSLVMTPRLEWKDVMETRKIKAKINGEGVMKADFSYACKGEKYELLSYLKSEASETQRSQYLSNNLVVPGFQLEDYSILTPERDTPEIKFEYTASSEKMMKEYGNESLLKIISLGYLYLEDPKKRKLPVQIDYPIFRIDTLEYTIPENYRVSDTPNNITLRSDYGEYNAVFKLQEHTVMAIRQLKINTGCYKPDEYQLYYDFMKSIFESDSSLYITLTKI